MRNQTLKSWFSPEQSLLGGMALASLAAACIWLVLGPAPDIADHLLAIVLLVALFLGALIVMYLVSNSRRQMQAALESRMRAEQRATETLRESEAQWKEVFEHNPVMYFMVDADGIVLSVNSFGAMQLGYPVSELRGASVLKVFREQEHALVRKAVAVCLANIGQTHSWEIRKIRKDRTMLWVRENAKAVRRLDGRLIVLIACEDITERREAENALRQSESYLAEAQRLSLTGSFGWRVATGEIIWSEETFRIFGYDKAPAVRVEMVVARVHPDDRAGVQRTIDRATRDGKDFDHEYRLLLPDGSIKHVHATARAVPDEAGGIEFVGAVSDITARKRAEEKLHEAQAELAHVTRVTALGELAASIAHEVNQPLAAVVANAAACQRWLDRDPPDLQEARSTVQSIVKDGNRAGEVIQRVRGLVNKTVDQRLPLDINEVINEVISLLGHELASHRMSLRMELSPAPGLVLGDRIQLQQVILNLVINGMEAMQQVVGRPRELVIRTTAFSSESLPRTGSGVDTGSREENASKQKDRALFRLDRNGKGSSEDEARQVLVTVSDCGTGLAAEHADRVFDAFFTTKSAGMGMGLSICRSIVEAHGGRLSASANQGPGATFHFMLPRHREDNAP